MSRLFGALCAALLFVGSGRPEVAAEETKPRDVSVLLRPIREKHDVPALAGAIVDGESLAAIGVDGVRRRGSPELATIDDLWHLGSETKSMTATLVAEFVEDGLVDWDLAVPTAFRDAEIEVAKGWKDATLLLLLQHRAGVPSSLDRDGLSGRLWGHSGSPVDARRVLVEGVLRHEPESAPGSTFLYANAGYAIAGAILETKTKRPWEELIVERLFEPLGMKSVGFGAPGSPDRLDQPRGHKADGTPVEPGPKSDNPPAISPAGRVHCTIGDWAKFVSLHLRGAQGKGKLLKPSSFERLHTPPPGADYACGWAVASRPWGGRVLTHTGSNTMWFATTWIAPEKDFAVLVTCNQGGDAATKAVDAACWALIQDHLAAKGSK